MLGTWCHTSSYNFVVKPLSLPAGTLSPFPGRRENEVSYWEVKVGTKRV